MIDAKLLDILRCPHTGRRLQVAEGSLIEQLNRAIDRGEVRDRLDQRVTHPVEAGLVSQEGDWLYPIRGGIPTLVAEEAIRLP